MRPLDCGKQPTIAGNGQVPHLAAPLVRATALNAAAAEGLVEIVPRELGPGGRMGNSCNGVRLVEA